VQDDSQRGKFSVLQHKEQSGREYSRINSTKFPALGADNVSEPRLMSQVGRLREVVCACISVFLQSERWKCHQNSTYVTAAVT
jgi:hypothetical protein